MTRAPAGAEAPQAEDRAREVSEPLHVVTLTASPAHEQLLDEFYRGLYWDAFEAQPEPLEVWKRALRGELPYRQTIQLVLDGERIVAGIAYELYPRSSCGITTYGVVAPDARRRGLGARLLAGAVAALYAAGARMVFGEVNDPRLPRAHDPDAAVAWARLERYQRWGWRVLAARYVQPALGPGLARDRGLLLLARPDAAAPPLAELDGAIPRAFVEELYAVTEGGPPDDEIAFQGRVPLVELAR
jgi:GNAT superfamily N-acetyltransferase